MTIKVTIPKLKDKIGIQKEIRLNVRKTLGEDLVVFDHPEVDIVIMPESNKILALAKNTPSDEVYEVQNRLFLLLRKEGIIEVDSIRSGYVYGSIEGRMYLNENVDMIQAALLGIDKFIQEEKPHYQYVEEFEQAIDNWIAEPEEEESTELGDVPHEPVKGSIRPGWIRGPYGMSIMNRV